MAGSRCRRNMSRREPRSRFPPLVAIDSSAPGSWSSRFEHLGDPEDEGFTEGITEEVTSGWRSYRVSPDHPHEREPVTRSDAEHRTGPAGAGRGLRLGGSGPLG